LKTGGKQMVDFQRTTRHFVPEDSVIQTGIYHPVKANFSLHAQLEDDKHT
jgi:hypothetical protein